MAQNKIPWHNIVSVVLISDLPITLALIMPYHWYGIVSRKWVMINAKYLSSNIFLIWNNAKIFCCSHFKCHIYKYLLNIRTMLEGWERFWWVGDLAGKRPFFIMMVTWLKYSPDWPHGIVYIVDFSVPLLYICLITVVFFYTFYVNII